MSRNEQGEGIPQVDGTTGMDAPDDADVEVEFVSSYAEEDINDSLKKIFDDKLRRKLFQAEVKLS